MNENVPVAVRSKAGSDISLLMELANMAYSENPDIDR